MRNDNDMISKTDHQQNINFDSKSGYSCVDMKGSDINVIVQIEYIYDNKDNISLYKYNVSIGQHV